jgi:flagellar basal-body rod modification protein FlgD
MTAVDPVTNGTASSGAIQNNAQGIPQLNNTDQLDENTFLKLLVAQLKYQNPLQPTDPSAFMAQTAQFTQVEKLNQLVQMQTQQQTTNQLLLSSSLVGKSVTYDYQGASVTGVVSAVQLSSANPPVLRIDGHDIQLTAVTEIDQT